MAVNHADGMLFGLICVYSVYPVFAGCSAFSAGARWSLPLDAVVGLAIGLELVFTTRQLIYSLLEHVLKSRLMVNDQSFVAAAVGCPLPVVYVAFPHVVTAAGASATDQTACRAVEAVAFCPPDWWHG